MSTSQAATSTQPIYIPPEAIHKEIPKRWAKNMEALVVVMREIPDKVAEEDVAWEWMERFEEGQIEGLHTFTADMDTEVPHYPEETEEAISSSFMTLGKTAQPPSSSVPVGGKVRQSHQQQEKAAMVDEGSKDTSHAANSVAIRVATASSREAPAVEQEQATVIDNVMQGLGSGMIGATQALQGTKEPSCEACHVGKKKCDKAGKPGRKQKNPDAPPVSLALTSKRARTMPVPPPLSSAPPKVTLKVCPRVVSRAIPATGAATSLPMPQETPIPSISSSPGDPLFLSSSRPNTPVPPHHISPPPIPENDGLIDNSAVFSPPISGILKDKANPVKPQPNMEEIDLTMPCRLLLPEEDVPRAQKGKHRADSSEWSPFEELDARITAIEESIEWGEETLLDLYLQMAQVTADAGQVSTAL
ncbi:hypothetical protein PISMIDRAFT_14156 [Pisolithus microcarpus 441]|uniref:Uncharacterized protein n=1 Tax=Pisolithus microcarpus 441 TaxID=765257 RepID=A0A0C9YQ21_9AGAM|nr:hypothetical protein PISMIDRAFT_14156 [Pisolithus microcarpus 441]